MKRRSMWMPSTLLVTGLLASCTQAAPVVNDPVSLTQGVDVNLMADSSIASIQSNSVTVGNDGTSSSEQKAVGADMIGQLPVRISSSYSTESGQNGTDLSELEGYSGQINIKLNVQNLTVAAQDVSYDVAGESKSDPALVGAPMTVVASAIVPGVRVDQMIVADEPNKAGTNGVVSMLAGEDSSGGTGKEEGNSSVVQWATLLAPPISPAQTTLELSAEVDNFKVPTFDISVQPGINTDPSATGALSTLSQGGGSNDLALQKQTIDVVMSVNEVLSRAGETVSDVRENLETTSGSLGVDTAKSLETNSESLAESMKSVREQVEQLGEKLQENTENASDSTTAQMTEVVSAMDSMLGDTSSEPPAAVLEGSECGVSVKPAGDSYSVYSSLTQISSQLDGYAQATAECRDALSQALTDSIGPAEPTDENCQTPSMTCAFRDSSLKVTEELIKLVINGEVLIQELQPELINNASSNYRDLKSALEGSQVTLQELNEDSQFTTAEKNVAQLRTALEEANDELAQIEESVATVHQTAMKNIEQIGDITQPSSMRGQNEQLAREICELANKPGRHQRLSKQDAQKLLGYLTENSECLEDIEEFPELIPEPDPVPAPTEEPTVEPSQEATGEPEASQEPTQNPDPSETVEPAEPSSSTTAQPSESQPTKAPVEEPSESPSSTSSERPSLPIGEIEPAPFESPTSASGQQNENSDGEQARGETTKPSESLEPASEKHKMIKQPVPMEERLKQQADDWDDVLALTDLENSESGFGKNLHQFSSQLDNFEKQIDAFEKSLENGKKLETKQAEKLSESFDAVLSANEDLGGSLDELKLQQKALEAQIREAFAGAAIESSVTVNQLINDQVRVVAAQSELSRDAVIEAFNHSIVGLNETSKEVKDNAKNNVEQLRADLNEQAEALSANMDEQTSASIESIATATEMSARDVEGARTLLESSLNKVILDLGNRKVERSGLLGSLSTSAALSKTADYQLALASKATEEYSNLREEDVSTIMHRQAQIKASMQAAYELPAFGVDVPQGVASRTFYSFHLGGQS